MPVGILCRVCLAGNVIKQYCIQNIGLQDIYEAVSNNKLNTEDERPQKICFICWSQLQRCLKLSKMSQRAEQAITDLANNGMEITNRSLTMLNLGMLDNWIATTIELVSFDSNYKSTDVAIKEEPGEQIEEKPQINIKIDEMCPGVCRVCLTGNMRTYCIEAVGLKDIFEKVTNAKLYTEDGRPVTVCYICRMQLQRCRTFCQMSQRAEQMFTKLLNNRTEITYKIAHKLNLEMCTTQCISLGTSAIDNISIKAVKKEFDVKPEKELKQNVTAIKSNPDYICNECGENYESKHSLLGHLQSHTGKNTFSCDQCTKTFKTKITLKVHLQRHNSEHICNICNKVFREKDASSNHMRRHTGLKPFECNICYKTFSYKGHLQQHVTNHTGEQPYSCELCSVTFSNKKALRIHKSDHIGKNICIQCDRRFRTKHDLQRHYKIHTVEKLYCNSCNKAFYDKCSLIQHIRKHIEERRFDCKRCGRTFAIESHLLKHMRVHNEDKPFTCRQCGMTFTRKYNLELHTTRLHSEIRPYVCKKCCKPYTTNKDMLKHMEKTHGELIIKTYYACSMCEKSFSNNSRLEAHLKIHDGRKVSCNTCNKTFNRYSYLKRHLRTHTRKRPYTCDQCPRTFDNNTIYQKHKETHSAGKLYACNLCSKAFDGQYNLRRHIKTHVPK